MQQPWFLGCAMMSFRCCPKTLYGCSVRASSQRPASCERHRAWHQARRGGRTFEARARAEAQEALHEEQLHGLGPRHDVLHEGLESGAATLEELLRRGAGRLGADALGREPGELQPRARLLDLPRAPSPPVSSALTPPRRSSPARHRHRSMWACLGHERVEVAVAVRHGP